MRGLQHMSYPSIKKTILFLGCRFKLCTQRYGHRGQTFGLCWRRWFSREGMTATLLDRHSDAALLFRTQFVGLSSLCVFHRRLLLLLSALFPLVSFELSFFARLRL